MDVRGFTINDDGTLFVAMYTGEIYESDNIGDSWEQLGSKMWPNVSDLTIHQNGDIFASTQGYGVFRFDKNSEQWIRSNDGFGFANVFVMSLTSDSSGYLYAGVSGNSVFRTRDPIITSISEKEIKIPSTAFLAQNYPNPFNPRTTINYELKNKSRVEITIYDVTGRKVRKIIDQTQNSGTHSVSFDASNLASGVYIYKLKAGSFEQSRKMILLR